MRRPAAVNMTNIPFLPGEIGALHGKAGRKGEAEATLREAIALAKAEPEFARRHG
jgi:Flp pilus assembly protein TadD